MWGEPPQAGGGLKQEQATKVAVKNKSHFSNKARSLNRSNIRPFFSFRAWNLYNKVQLYD